MKRILLVAMMLTMFSGRAHADDNDGGAVVGIGAVAVLDASLVIGGLVTAIGGGVHLPSKRRNRGWRVANYVFGGLNLAASAGVIAGSLALGSSWYRDETAIWAPVAVTNFAVGAADLVIGLLDAQNRMPGYWRRRACAMRPGSSRTVSVILRSFESHSDSAHRRTWPGPPARSCG